MTTTRTIDDDGLCRMGQTNVNVGTILTKFELAPLPDRTPDVAGRRKSKGREYSSGDYKGGVAVLHHDPVHDRSGISGQGAANSDPLPLSLPYKPLGQIGKRTTMPAEVKVAGGRLGQMSEQSWHKLPSPCHSFQSGTNPSLS